MGATHSTLTSSRGASTDSPRSGKLPIGNVPAMTIKRVGILGSGIMGSGIAEVAAKSGFELVNIGPEQMDAFMADKTKVYTEGAQSLGLGKK